MQSHRRFSIALLFGYNAKPAENFETLFALIRRDFYPLLTKAIPKHACSYFPR